MRPASLPHAAELVATGIVLETLLQDAVLACGCLGALVRLTSSAEGELRLNATWALQNLVYQADADVRSALLRALTWQQALALANDIRSDVQVLYLRCALEGHRSCKQAAKMDHTRQKHAC